MFDRIARRVGDRVAASLNVNVPARAVRDVDARVAAVERHARR